MAAFVSLAQAKNHLRVPADSFDNNADISLKLTQAEQIVLGYLKNRRTAIASVSAANPAVVTTSVPHSLASGATYTIADTTTTPTVNGPFTVTVTGPTTFTVPVNVTVGQTTAAGSVWNPAWTPATVPGAVQAAVLLTLTHLYENRGENMRPDADYWSGIERLLMRLRDPALA